MVKAWVGFPIRIPYGSVVYHFRDEARYLVDKAIFIARQHSNADARCILSVHYVPVL